MPKAEWTQELQEEALSFDHSAEVQPVSEPTSSRPHIPGYGIPKKKDGMLP